VENKMSGKQMILLATFAVLFLGPTALKLGMFYWEQYKRRVYTQRDGGPGSDNDGDGA
jgi:hypothetical protein